jgi:dipeptidyl aminopeptidase/acylaminoacyl peptidase
VIGMEAPRSRASPAAGSLAADRAKLAAALLAGLGFAHAAAATPPPQIAEIIEVAEISGLAPSPDGRRVAFRTERARLDTNSYVLRWHVADLDRGTVAEVGGGGRPIYAEPGIVAPETAFWSPDGRFIHYRALVDDAIGVWRAPADATGARLIFEDEADVEALRMEPGGAALIVTLGSTRHAIRSAEQREYDEGVLVDHTVALNQNVHRGAFINGRLASQRVTGDWFRRVGLLWDVPRRQRSIDLDDLAVGEPAPAPPPDPPPPLGSNPGVSVRSSAGDVATLFRDGAGSRIEVRRNAGGSTIRCLAQACRGARIVAMAWRPGRDELILTAQDLHLGQSLHSWRPATGEVRLVTRSEGLLGGGRQPNLPCAVTAEEAVCVTAAATSPPRLERIDLDSGERTILFDPNPRLRATAMPRAERLAWSSLDGQSFTGILLLPAHGEAGRLPLFVSYYSCGGFLSGGVGDELPFLPLAGAGMAVACINIAPSERLEDSIGRYETGLEAVRSLVERLDELGTVDPRRVGMAGLSFGSEVTMWTAMHSDLLAAAAIASTQAEPAYYWYNAVRGRSQPEQMRRIWGLGAPDETPEEWRRQSPALNAERLRAPLLLQLPEQEARSVIELYARLTNSTTPAELYVFPDSAHIKVQPRQRLAAHSRYQDWFRYWLQGYSDPDPAKADQYRRWTWLAERQRAGRSSTP